MRQLLALLLFAALSAPAVAQHQPAAPHSATPTLAAECEQLIKDTDTLATGAFCYRDNPEVSAYFNELSLILLFDHPKAELCRHQLRHSPAKNYRLNADSNKLCIDSRAERARLRRQIEALVDEKMPEYAAEEAPRRGLTAAELLRRTRAEEAARRARVDVYIRQTEGQ
ncbi:hypothetical protein A7P95_10545 [Eikenella longinqua]|uniref:Uncharacterized protein n=1 Tax=Eikenella longinqua TaxID=1795827 RepID=A0A1A9RUZ5_9NEIS|nr:hypothetical protein [Eikenella longinqua]OAM26133.1 hypothetical protein A7P95_10545 [Eikenella longinqua]